MKKLMIALAAVAMAAGVQAAAVNWKSGNMNGAASSAGGWSDTAISKTATAGTVTMTVYLISAADWAADGVADMTSQKALHDYALSKAASVDTYDGQNLNTKGAAIPGITIGTDDLAANKTYYTVITAEYTDTSLGSFYMATKDVFTTTDQGEYNLGSAISGIADWQTDSTPTPTPEPTSGLLLLLGVAGLALRRKQK